MSSVSAKRALSSYPDECFVSKRRRSLATLSDEFAWEYDAQELIGEQEDAHIHTTM
jgi:hypothetical protein